MLFSDGLDNFLFQSIRLLFFGQHQPVLFEFVELHGIIAKLETGVFGLRCHKLPAGLRISQFHATAFQIETQPFQLQATLFYSCIQLIHLLRQSEVHRVDKDIFQFLQTYLKRMLSLTQLLIKMTKDCIAQLVV